MSKRRASNGSRWGRRLMGILSLAFLAVGVGMSGYSWSTWSRAQAARAWHEVPATILDVELQTHRDSDGGTTSRVVCNYRYAYRGHAYTQDRVGLHGGSDNIGSWQQQTYQRLYAAHRAGQTVTAYVNPDDPSESLLDRRLRTEMLLFITGFGAVFGSIGVGLLIATLGARPPSATSADSTQPWLNDRDWAAGVVWPRERGRSSVAWALVFYWHAAGLPLLMHLPVVLRHEPGWPAYVSLVHPAIGLILLAWAVRAMLFARRWGGTCLELRTLPGVIGGAFEADLVLAGQVVTPDQVRLTLRCIESVTVGRGKNARTERRNLWEATSTHAEIPSAFGQDVIRLPARFTVPHTCKPTDDDNSEGSVTWELLAESSVPGVDMHLTFPVPVFRTAESDPAITELSAESAERGARGSSEIDAPPPGILVTQDAVGVDLLTIRRWPGWVFFGMFVGIGLVFVGVGVGLVIHAWGDGDWFQLLFGAVFLLMGSAVACVGVFTLGVDRIVVGQGRLISRRSLLGITRGWEADLADIQTFSSKESASSSGGDTWYALHAKLKGESKKRSLASMIRGRTAVQWLKARLESHLHET